MISLTGAVVRYRIRGGGMVLRLDSSRLTPEWPDASIWRSENLDPNFRFRTRKFRSHNWQTVCNMINCNCRQFANCYLIIAASWSPSTRSALTQITSDFAVAESYNDWILDDFHFSIFPNLISSDQKFGWGIMAPLSIWSLSASQSGLLTLNSSEKCKSVCFLLWLGWFDVMIRWTYVCLEVSVYLYSESLFTKQVSAQAARFREQLLSNTWCQSYNPLNSIIRTLLTQNIINKRRNWCGGMVGK